jgi:hypothetical protein
MTTATKQPTWATPHQAYILQQHQESTEDGTWKTRRTTGLVNAVCNCGHSTGWVETEDMDWEQWRGEHAQPTRLDAPFVP